MSKSKHVDPIQGEIIHEYDGILEADNRLPLWWLWTFFAAIVFSTGYWFYYQEFKAAPGLQEAYFIEKAEQQEKTGSDPTDEQLMAQLGTPAIEAGAAAFATNCVACHEQKGQGKIGPNLTDNMWIHGGSPLDIYKTIRDGIPAKGMPSWGPTLGRAAVTQLAGFILSIRDSNVPGKAPEGTPYVPGEAAPASEKPAEPAETGQAPKAPSDTQVATAPSD